MQENLKHIRRSAALGLWGSVALVILTVIFIYASRYRFYPSEYTARWMVVAGTVLAVLAVSMTLLTVRRQVPRLRQTDGMEEKLRGYASHVRSLYLTMFFVVLLLCAITLFSAHNVLLMLAMVCTLVLFLNYPNIYRIKVDLGLTDDEMSTLDSLGSLGDLGSLENPKDPNNNE